MKLKPTDKARLRRILDKLTNHPEIGYLFDEVTKRILIEHADDIAQLATLVSMAYLAAGNVTAESLALEDFTRAGRLAKEIGIHFGIDNSAPREVILSCPACSQRHIDKGSCRRRPTKSHVCDFCMHVWTPYDYPTIGV